MTPQLQQAIRLLQLSTLELQQEIQQALESNPLLEDATDFADNSDEINAVEDSISQEDISSIKENLSDELPSDTSWDEVFDMSTSDSSLSTSSHTSAAEGSNLLETLNAETTDLKDHLSWQVNASNLSIQDKIIAATIIDALDERGYLCETVNDIFLSLSDQLLIEPDEVTAVLHYLQRLDPLGVAARDLQECLLIQLQSLYSGHELYQKAHLLLEKNLDLLEKRNYIKIKKLCQLNDQEYERLIQLICSLNPEPGRDFENNTTGYITPDIYVSKTPDDQWIATLNQDAETRLRVNDYYQKMIPTTGNHNDKKYLKDQLQHAKWFIKTLQNRNNTILSVAEEIIKQQSGFLKYGDQAMKPMTLKDIAGRLGLHESTISRVSTQKYMHTPHGIYELKHFFSSHVSTSTGGECSSTAIRAMIQQLIDGENRRKPLSDNKLTDLLKKQGINVARRTVAKYREAMTIPSSRERKSLA